MLKTFSSHLIPLNTHLLYKTGLEYLLCDSPEQKTELLQISTLKPKGNVNKPVQKISVKPALPQSSPRSSEEAKEQNIPPKKLFPYPVLTDYQWPETWENLWKNTIKISNPTVVWTYPGLNHDLNNKEDSPRKSLIRQLRKSLGTLCSHAFWPFDQVEHAGSVLLEEESHLFWSGILRLKPRALFVFGSQSRDGLLLPKHGNYTSFQHLGYIIHIFPDPNRILEKPEDINTLEIFMKKKLELSLN